MKSSNINCEFGVTLVETIMFLVVMGIALTALLMVFSQSVVNSVDPVVRVKALEVAQSQLDEIMSRKFDENTPTGGFPACGSADGPSCLGISPDGDFDDVGDYAGFSDNAYPLYPVSVTVVNAGDELGDPVLPVEQARRITVTVGMPGGDTLTLSAYRTNF
ncbi:type IV pilus modification PilV family protein [Teredinibacter franksiae]|jgi:hypothetical protein|uniref:type IV pilus modification PilV family protein n=1 Tax=Teredinibacter franksiae TaxID=2761453 RepID=UPI0016240B2A|nr:type II secretion system protein [Teredinibacter franksiae]